MNWKTLICVFGVVTGAAIVIDLVNTKPPSHELTMIDTSGSLQTNCGGVVEQARMTVRRPGIREGSRMTLMSIGIAGSDPNPRVLFDEVIPFGTTNVTGYDPAALETQRTAFFAKLRAVCESAPKARQSPILHMVRRGIEHLNTTCPPGSECYLDIRTDMLEDVDPRFTGIIVQAVRNPAIELPPDLAGSIDNTRTRVTIFGAAETTPRGPGSRPQVSADTLTRLFKGLFRKPGMVAIQPYGGGQ